MKGLFGRMVVSLIRGYQRHISAYTKPHCRFIPTCSQYAIEAVETHGAFKGSFLALWRILRCNPFSKGGYDPVPPKKS
ncbi:MAG: membrane protein insertion efficiency factor YidD [Clostridia bacterium]|nr:membrane protein insertion efficiency factor YidD [Clostridia bacterium]